MKFLIGLLLLASQLSSAAEPAGVDKVTGTYTYRSFHNEPALTKGDGEKLRKLLFGEGIMQLTLHANDTITGTLAFGSAVLDMSGALQRSAGNGPHLLELTGTGLTGTPTAGWIYEYKMSPNFDWAHAVNPRHTLVGTVIRTAHPPAQPGHTASFIMIKQ